MGRLRIPLLTRATVPRPRLAPSIPFVSPPSERLVASPAERGRRVVPRRLVRAAARVRRVVDDAADIAFALRIAVRARAERARVRSLPARVRARVRARAGGRDTPSAVGLGRRYNSPRRARRARPPLAPHASAYTRENMYTIHEYTSSCHVKGSQANNNLGFTNGAFRNFGATPPQVRA